MSQPKLTIYEVDGALAALPVGAFYPAFVGVSSTGTVDTPLSFGSKTALTTAKGYGAVVELAAAYIEQKGRPCVVVNTGSTVAASFGSIDVTGVTGTSVVTAAAGIDCNDDYEVKVLVSTGCTVGTTGGYLQYSLDGGRTYSPPTALGTDTSFTIPNSGGVEFDFAAGTLVAGDYFTIRCNAPLFNSTELTSALTALRQSTLPVDAVVIVGELDGTTFDALTTAIAAFYAANKPVYFIASTRIPDDGESEGTYKTALDAIFTSKSSVYGAVGAGACEVTSSISGRKYRRPATFAWAPQELAADDHDNIAEVSGNALVGVSIADEYGNPKHHDESINPGLDDSRFVTLRTWEDRAGVYCNRPRLFSPAGSDFELIPHRRVMNLARRVLRSYFTLRLSKPVAVNLTTGFILESEAREIESGANAALRAALLATPKASGGGFTNGDFVQISRTDNLISTKTMTVQGRIVPLAYLEYIDLYLGFYNPALALVAA